ncbi:MAG TPA: class I SAM-dependent methyltransferase [Steroidobacteraceae bacterium]|nr:class I SAM-dependent methyltransferase [Steroidobacteraceae bacterium]
MYSQISRCRACGNEQLDRVVDLGTQVLSGVFPRSTVELISSGPLRLLKCAARAADACGLLQLEHSYDLDEMYGVNYGYRSGLNPSMVRHLHGKVGRILERVRLRPGSLIVDIGSNDSTTLQAYPQTDLTLVGIDPTGVKFERYYPPHIRLIPEFFSAARFRELFPGQRASVVTSFSMFYDLEHPVQFMREIAEVLADDGLWVLEQSYMPTMLARTSYDTVCHEHLEYYGLQQIQWMAQRAGLKIIDVELNDVNGGSFSVVVTRQGAPEQSSRAVESLLASERGAGLDGLAPYREFAHRSAASRAELLEFFSRAAAAGKRVLAIGASTKGNIILQYCGLGPQQLAYVGDVNEDKFGRLTPGTLIPIVPEDQVLAMRPDYLLVLPWHFRAFFERNPKFSGRTLVFPLPRLEVVRLP